jgi:heme exporter protein C
VCWALAAAFAAAGLYMGFCVAPTDATQGEVYRIIFIHVPTAWMSMLAVPGDGLLGRGGLGLPRAPGRRWWRARIAPTGALFTFLALWTGALLGPADLGTYWVWDARLTSELILLFLYLGYIALTAAIDDTRRADQAGALLAVVGAVNVPIIYFSVKWWNTLHQGASVSLTAAPRMASHHAHRHAAHDPCLLDVHLRRVFVRTAAPIMLERERARGWVRELAAPRGRADELAQLRQLPGHGGHGFFVWGSLRRVRRWRSPPRLAERARRRHAALEASAASRRAHATRSPKPHEAAHTAAAGHRGRWAWPPSAPSSRLGAQRLPEQPRVLLLARRRWRRNEAPRDAPSASAGWSQEGSVQARRA